MSGPGWYPDPENPSVQRFFDGRQWTGHSRPDPRDAASTPPVQDVTAQHPTGQEYPPQQYPQQQYPQQQYPPQQYPQQQYPTQQLPFPAPAGPGAGYGGPGPGAPAFPEQPPGWGQPPRRSRRKVALIVGGVVVLVAGLVTGGVLLWGGSDSPTFTYNGKAISNPQDVLTETETTVSSIVTSRHGAAKDTRCYFATPRTAASGTKASDIDQNIWCGPVLFVDGTPERAFLRFPITSTASGGRVTLSTGSSPAAPDPEALPTGFSFARPDGATPPDGAGGLTAPAPPPAGPDSLQAVDIGKQSVPPAPPGAVIGSTNGGVALTALGPVSRFGTGDQARTAPPGQKLIAFKVAAGYDESGAVVDLSGAASVVVDGEPARRLPQGTNGQYVVLALPTGARSAELVLSDGGYRQSLSLLTGKPGASNISVLARRTRRVPAARSAPVQISYSLPVDFGNGQGVTSETLTVSTYFAELHYSYSEFNAKASAPSKALLYVRINYTSPNQPGRYGLPPELLRFTPRGGSPVAARNIATKPDQLVNVFEVPGSITTGTLTVTGSVTRTFTNTGRSYVTSVTSPVDFPVSFPAN